MNRDNKNIAFRVVAQLVLLLSIAIISAGCSLTHRVMKSGDPWLIYNTGLDLYHLGEWSKASTLFEAVETYFNDSEREDSLQFFIARCAYKDGDFYLATERLDAFRRTYGRSPFLEDAEGMYAMSYYYLSPSANRDQAMTEIAIMAIDEFVSRHPNSEQYNTFGEIRKELVEKLHEKAFINAYTYFKIGRYKSAIVAFKNAMKEYPESHLREKISFYIVASAYELAHNSVESKREDRYLSMIDSYYTFIAEYPESSYRQKVDEMLEEARRYIEKRKRIEQEGEQVEENEIFWKRLFGKRKIKDADGKQIEKVNIDEIESKQKEQIEEFKEQSQEEYRELKQRTKGKIKTNK